VRGLGHLIVRLVVVMVGLAIAFIGASLFISIGFYTDVLTPMAADMETTAPGVLALALGLVWSPFLATAAFFPALVAVFFAEWLRLRGLTVNLALGGVVALAATWLHTDLALNQSATTGPLVVVLATGFVAGLCYWLVAGRNAGKWLEPPAE
jgi:hypothetical protein